MSNDLLAAQLAIVLRKGLEASDKELLQALAQSLSGVKAPLARPGGVVKAQVMGTPKSG